MISLDIRNDIVDNIHYLQYLKSNRIVENFVKFINSINSINGTAIDDCAGTRQSTIDEIELGKQQSRYQLGFHAYSNVY
jgi:hypothetical protein